MKILSNKITPLIVGLLFSNFTFAAPEPPQPTPLPPPGFPIDGGIMLLLVAAIIFGTYKILYIKKASIRS